MTNRWYIPVPRFFSESSIAFGVKSAPCSLLSTLEAACTHGLRARPGDALPTQTPTDKDLPAGDATVPHGLADLLLVLIHPCSIDMPRTYSQSVSPKATVSGAAYMRTYIRSSAQRGRQASRRRSDRLPDQDEAARIPKFGPHHEDLVTEVVRRS